MSRTANVVITGMGAVSPNGIGNEAFCRGALDGMSGVRRITRFDSSDLPVQIAGEVAGLDELAWVDAHERKHLSRSVPVALAASTEALQQAGIDPTKLSLTQQREIGVVLGSGGGAQDFSEENYNLYFHGKAKQASIFSIPSGTMGTMSSEISMRFGLRGMSHVITTGCTSSTDAFGYALREIQFGFIPALLVGGVERLPTRESPSCRNRMAQFARRRYTALCVEALEHGKAWLIRGELVYVDDNSDSAGRERIGNAVPPWVAQKTAR